MQIIAHRGASGDYPENTLLAIEQAITQGADAVEIDVFAVQGELIVIHDHHLARTTNGSGSIYQHNLAQLQQLDAGLGQRIPTLWQVLQLLAPTTLWLNIELKGDNTVAPLLPLLERAKHELEFDPSRLLISSFNHHLLAALKLQLPALKLGALTASMPVDYAAFAQQLQADSVNCDVSFINQAFVDDAKARSLKVYVYTVDQADDIARMAQYGVDGIFSNYPARSRQRLNSQP
ncbi:MAG: glycerophosphodiester phosphodiesterase [Gammaproteobacteria bacterium]|nr:glycerophosphodiester phosphodiesterase [Gammaproteobacteria bacterium]MBU1554581.1 glycerophosphodiester phosphodiesterase [Gammaproteobacteria bacterium]MBU2068736.1 glycerophosphodiester phosphodiesterase [Gammaproteobacteria bacterium]MBU2185183.1 glycerophosphodiester phosphodiesterase [Gammaproteobacteria bacterium]MBU2203195.1 glycerophosphodiester phosphodiesterase [Gammaproteobacteria bacterium]